MKNKMLKFLIVLLPMILLSVRGWSQEAAGSSPFYEKFLANGLLLFSLIIIIGAVFALFHLLNVMVKVQQLKIYEEQGIEAFKEAVEKQKESWWSRQYKRWTQAVPVEKEEDIMFDHEFDGIRELDNSLPPWWVAMFYITIAIGVVYFSYYHVFQAGPSSAEKYERQMAQAEEQVQAYLASQANLVDETNVEALTDETQLALGKSIFDANCLACHGAFGEGGVGPNLTDQYWIHGGSIKDVFRTIKYGVPEKGMISWQSQLGASEMHQVASYIMTLVGTNPPNGKDPEGELYQAETMEQPADTTMSDAIGMLDQ